MDMVQGALQLMVNGGEHDFTTISSIYPFTNEYLRGYFPLLSLEDKRVLTVCGSGDQALNAYLLGAREIDQFDINALSYYYYQLKRTAIENLSYEEFMQFFQGGDIFDDCILSEKVFKLIEDKIKDSQIQDFWHQIYLYRKSRKYHFADLFRLVIMFRNGYDRIKVDNLYLEDKGYRLLQEKLVGKKDSFTACDIRRLPYQNRKPYDVILLSNIWDYVGGHQEQFLLYLKQLKYSLLKPDGIIALYNFGSYLEWVDEEYETDVRTKPALSIIDMDLPYSQSKDKILVYK